MAKVENGLPCETIDDSVAQHYAGYAANWPLPLGLDAREGHATGVLYPASLPSPYLGLGYPLGYGTSWTRDLATRVYNGAYYSSPAEEEFLRGLILMHEDEIYKLTQSVRDRPGLSDSSTSQDHQPVEQPIIGVHDSRGTVVPRSAIENDALGHVGNLDIGLVATMDKVRDHQGEP